MRPRTYWHALVNSVSSAQYYQTIVKAPFWFSFRFFVISMVLLGIVMSLRLQQQVLPAYQEAAEAVVTDLYQYYPDELVMKWDGTKLSLSPDEPLRVDWPAGVETSAEMMPDGFIIIDLNQDSFTDSSLLAVNQNTLFINDLQGQWNSLPLVAVLGADEVELRKENLPMIIEQAKQYIRRLFDIIDVAAYAVVPMMLIISRLWIGLLESLLMFLILKLNSLKLSFAKTYQLSLHLLVVTEIVAQLANWLYPTHQLPLFTLTFWLMFLYILGQNRRAWIKSAG